MRREKAEDEIIVSDYSRRESARREPKSYRRDGKIRIPLVAQIGAGQFAPFSRILPRLARGLEAGPSGRRDVAALHHDGGSPLKEEEPVRYPRTRTRTHTWATSGTDECTQTRRAPAIATESRGRERGEKRDGYGVLRGYVYSYVTPASTGSSTGCARATFRGNNPRESRSRGAPRHPARPLTRASLLLFSQSLSLALFLASLSALPFVPSRPRHSPAHHSAIHLGPVVLITRLGLRTRTGTPGTRETFRAPEKKTGVRTFLVRTRVPSLSLSLSLSLLLLLLSAFPAARSESLSPIFLASLRRSPARLFLSRTKAFLRRSPLKVLCTRPARGRARARLFYTPNVIQRWSSPRRVSPLSSRRVISHSLSPARSFSSRSDVA